MENKVETRNKSCTSLSKRVSISNCEIISAEIAVSGSPGVENSGNQE